MLYLYENLNDENFENLTVEICRDLLGIGCKNFAKGTDGAKDGWFDGTASNYPSPNNPWSGKFIIQAKHTQTHNASCSDDIFSSEGNKASILNKEIKRLKEVKKEQHFDHYLLFTNRKLSGIEHPRIIKKIKEAVELSNVEIIGREQISQYLDSHNQLAHKWFNKLTSVFRFFDKDIAEVIHFFGSNLNSLATNTNHTIDDLELITIEEKNKLNNLGEEYFELIQQTSLQYFRQIDDFLKNPKNTLYARMYSNTVNDLKALIILERNRFGEFQHVLEHLYEYIIENHREKLNDNRQLIRVFVHFMYFNCDIGRKK